MDESDQALYDLCAELMDRGIIVYKSGPTIDKQSFASFREATEWWIKKQFEL